MPKTLLMAILNITPDSFYPGSRAASHREAVAKALQLAADGADILDVGGESTRPGAPPVDEAEELQRVIPVLEELKEKLSIPISVDTTKPAVARAAVKAGATLLNDVTGFTNPEMVAVAQEYDLDVCVMHMLGNPRTMQSNPHYEQGVVAFLLQWFEERANTLIRSGIRPKKIILDPGIGFGKTVAHNLAIIHNLHFFRKLGYRILMGASRKSFLGKILNLETDKLLPATIAINTLAVNQGVDIIRVHDVKEHRAVLDLMDTYAKI